MSTVRAKWLADKLPEEIHTDLLKELKRCGEDLLGEARLKVPYLSGDLSNSGETYVDKDSMTTIVTFGSGKSKPYARRQHEDTRLTHRNGREAKFLENPFKANIDKYFQWLKSAITKHTGGT